MRFGKVELTEKQFKILDHRLTAPDAMADALERMVPREKVSRISMLLSNGDYEQAVEEHGEENVHHVLIDAVEGSTYLALAYDAPDVSSGEYAGLVQSGRGLVDKIGDLVNCKRQLTIPVR